MTISNKEHRDCIVLNLTGDFDLYSAQDFKQHFLNSTKTWQKIVINLNDVRYIDSSGIGVLLFAFFNCDQCGKNITFCNLNYSVRQVLKLSQLDVLLPLSSDINDAVNKLLEKERV